MMTFMILFVSGMFYTRCFNIFAAIFISCSKFSMIECIDVNTKHLNNIPSHVFCVMQFSTKFLSFSVASFVRFKVQFSYS